MGLDLPATHTHRRAHPKPMGTVAEVAPILFNPSMEATTKLDGCSAGGATSHHMPPS